ncbi:ribonuclease HII [candidate division KSB1 bacterium]|nr:ribonuclease HII [candidate division KSB1 bacterium]
MELNLFRSGVTCFCGVDEAGRGPLAGPVVAAAVVFVDDELIWSARDSKSLSRRRREELATRIRERFDFGIGMADAEEIDRINILQASLQAMARAVDALRARPSVMLVDGNQRVPHAVRSIAIVKGDARVRVISAASILAKVERDRIMHDLHILYPDYGFARHLGYPTSEHRAKLAKYGPCPIHRMTFRGVREHVRGAS